MAARKLFVVFAILAGLFAFQGTMAEALPREKVRTELVVGFEIHASIYTASPTASEFFIRETSQKSQVEEVLFLSLILAYQHCQSSL